MDYIEALHAVFGSVEKLSDLMHKFVHTHQHRWEKLSDYITQVDKILHQIIQKKVIDQQDAEDTDRARLDQIVQGAHPNHPIIHKFLQKGSRTTWNHPELVKVIREEAQLKETNVDFNAKPIQAPKKL